MPRWIQSVSTSSRTLHAQGAAKSGLPSGGVAEVKDQSADFVMAIDVVEHIEGNLGFLRQFRLKGRYGVLHIPLDLSLQAVFRMLPILAARESLGHIHYFT